MTAFALRTPPEILFGPGESRKAAGVAARFGRRVFLVTGARSIERTGFLDGFRGREIVRWTVSGEPEVAVVDEGARHCREAGCDVVVAAGGGSVLDAAKAAAAMATNEGSVRDYLEQVGLRHAEAATAAAAQAGTGRTLAHPLLPIVAVPTTAGSGSEATRNAVIRVPELGVKRSLRHDSLMPRAAIVDPELSAAAPRDVAASAGLDALTHLIEGYTSTGANPATDALALPGIRLAAQGLRALVEDRGPTGGMALAALWGGMVLANAGLGAVHGLVAPLGGRCRIAHGTGCACLLVETLRANVRALRERAPASPALARYAEVAAALGHGEIEAALENLRSLRTRLGVRPLGSYGVAAAELPGIVKDSRGGSMRSNPVELTDAELEGVLRDCLAG